MRRYLVPMLALVCMCGLSSPQPAVEKAIPHMNGGTGEQVLDVYWSADVHASLVLFIHGGSLREAGERRSSPVYRDVCVPFVASGIACASMDYRLSPGFQWPAMPDDVVAAVVKLRQLTEARGGDPRRLFLFGHSSGCLLAAIVGANPVYLKAAGLSPSDIAGIIPMGCTLDRQDVALRQLTGDVLQTAFSRDAADSSIYGSVDNWLSANPASFVGPHVPPTLVVLSTGERFAPPILEQAARFVRRLRAARVPADVVVVPGEHMDSIESLNLPGNPALHAIRAFIQNPRSIL